MRLSELKTGESATILKVTGHGGFRRRIMEMGFVRGQRVEVLLNAPLKDPIEYKIMGYDISLRRTEADMVVVLSDSEVNEYLAGGHHHHRHHPGHRHGQCGCGTPEQAPEYPAAGTPDADDDCATADEVISRHSRTIGVALVGNPNSGKTSLFNAISGGHEHVGNYSGVTVGAKSGHRYYRGYRFEVTDLPGTYALSAYTPEERYVRSHIAEKTPDVIINSVVASNLERNLYLTTELIDINPRMVVALNMYDELDSRGSELDYDNLGRMLGVPMVPVEARNGKGIEALLDTVIAVYENQDERVRHIHINMGPVIEEGLRRLKDDMSDYRGELPKAFPPRYYAMKMLEGDKQVEEQLRGSSRYPEWAEIRDREAKRIAEALGEDVETAFANQKYGFIQGALKETYTPGKREEASATKLIDTFVTHKLWGFPIFFFLMWLMFWCTFSLGAYPQESIYTLVGWIGSGVDALLPAGPLRDLLVDGIIGGVGAVIVFLPNIMILYLFISFMEDSGYLARAAFIMDRVMHRIGLHGKSFIPLIMGFGCNVPAIMACRTIESRSSRLITILITPFMSCSADMEDDAHPHVGQMRAIPAQDGRHDPDRFDGRMVPELLPPQRRGRHGGPLRELLPRASGAKLCADFQSAGAELEGGRGTAVGCPGQGDRRQHARRALFRRRGGGNRPRRRHDGDRHGIGRKDRDRKPAGRQHRHYRRGGRTDGDPHCGKR